ncbi:MAG: 8-amino-7-oxononanoate synthase [Bacteroidota bacterium]|nr:8-amino-7-oxononanoate synthase [Bacteroidota bacterium]
MNEIHKRLKSKIESSIQNNTFRHLRLNDGLADFSSNDYLGLSRSEKLIDKINSTFSRKVAGATGSRLLSGNSLIFEETEKYLANLFHAEKALIFNSGYNANLGILSSVPGKGDTIIYDELIHSSLKDGARLSLAQHLSFRHNDFLHLEKKIKIAKGNIFVVVESIYSMDGDECKLIDLISLCEKYGAAIILDEAHSTGTYGNNGNGIACSLGIQDKIFARVYTFGKAMGLHGACIAGPTLLINYLINYSRQFIYTTALPPHAIHAIKQSFEHLGEYIELQDILNRKIALFKNEVSKSEIKGLIKSNSAIQALVVGNTNLYRTNAQGATSNEPLQVKQNIEDQKFKTKLLAAKLQEKGFDVRPILSPTVKEGSERLRICLHVHNPDKEIIDLVHLLKEGMDELKAGQ